jgi:ATP:ADP antiporter, AAA family
VGRSHKYTSFERLLELITKVRPGEGRTVALFGAHIFLILFSYYLFKAAREGLLLARLSAADASYATAITATLLMFIVPLYGQVRRRLDGPRLVIGVIAFFVVCLVAFWGLDRLGVRVGFAFFVFVGIFAVMMTAQFWALAADSFNIKSGQRLFPAIMLAAQIGALSGTEFAEYFSVAVGTHNLLLVGAAMLLVTAFFTLPMHASVPDESRHLRHETTQPVRRMFGGFEVIARSRYLVLIALMIVLINWISSTGDFIHRGLVKAHFAEVASAGSAPGSQQDLISAYFGNFQFWFVLVGLLLQTLVVGRLFRWLGVATTLLIPPLVSLFGYGLFGFLPILTTIRLARIIEAGTEYSVTNTCRQALFLPTDRTQTYEGKTAIETFFWRFGDLLQAGVVFVGTQYLSMGAANFALLNVVLAVIWTLTALAIGREYRRLARENLTNAAPSLTRPIPHADYQPGERFEHVLPTDLFADTDPGDVLTLSARLADGRPLPGWLQFDALHGRFHAHAVEIADEQLHIMVTATDHDGSAVSGMLVLRRVIVLG